MIPSKQNFEAETLRTDLRDTAAYREAEALYQAVRRPGSGLISDATELAASETHAVFAGSVAETLNDALPTRICLIDLVTGDTRVLTCGPNIDRLPKFAPRAERIAFLSDRQRAGDFQLYLLDPVSSAICPTPRIDGWVEYFHWSPDGKKVLLGVAGHGADIAGGQGAIASRRMTEQLPSWMPTVDSGEEIFRWRRAWIYDPAAGTVCQVSRADLNIWEAVWCGNDAITAVASPGSAEGLWYSARLYLIDATTGEGRELYSPQDQLGWPGGSPSGKHVAIVEAICSDRWVVAGDLRLIDTASGLVRSVDTLGVDITYCEWRSDERLLLAGHRGLETVIGIYDLTSDTFSQIWSSAAKTTGSRYAAVAGINAAGDCALVSESFVRAPEIALIRNGQYRAIKSFDLGYEGHAKAIDTVDQLQWRASDGREIQGWLLRPAGRGPYPVIMNVHGGPVSLWQPRWLVFAGLHLLLLVKHGYAVFLPNPRGSSGRGQDFARQVVGDMGGADTCDLLCGLDYLCEQGLADPVRLGVTGRSYGGFMTAWLISQDPRFAAAIPIAPVTNQVTQHLLSNIPQFVSLFLADTYRNAAGKYSQRSPIMHAHKVKTPTLNICGALDRCTPPEEALQFHSALLENGVESVLVTYPEEGHGVRKLPAAIDFAARVVSWVEGHMPAAGGHS